MSGVFSAPVASPCTQVCQMDNGSGWCRGCGRTLGEIAAWSQATDPQRRLIVEQLPSRREALRRQGLLLGAWAEETT